jgi:hypothetical protein
MVDPFQPAVCAAWVTQLEGEPGKAQPECRGRRQILCFQGESVESFQRDL